MSRHLDDTGTGHPILGFLDLLEAGLDEIKDAPVWSLDSEDTTAAVRRLIADLARLAEVESRLLGQAQTLELPAEAGIRSLSRWLAVTTRMTGGEAARHTKLAKGLAAHEATRAAVAAGGVLAEQAAVITGVVDDLDDEYSAQRTEAEEHLIAQAAHFDAHQLRLMGQRLFEVIDPDGADAYEAKKLAAQEAKARKKTEFRMWNAGDGQVHGRFSIPEVQAEMLRKALHALAAPKHVRATDGAGAYDHEKPSPQRMGHAFVEYIENYPTDKLPRHGGMNATIVITVEADVFTKDAQKAGHTENGVGVSPGQLLRWACQSKLLPAVLDTQGHVLDLGRTRRFHTPAQRLALIIEQKTCQHPACDVPGSFCHVHHSTAWSQGGETNTTDAVLLCPYHHHQAHTDDIDYPIRT